MTVQSLDRPEITLLGAGLYALLIINVGLGTGSPGLLYLSVTTGTAGMLSLGVCLLLTVFTVGRLRVIAPAVYVFFWFGLIGLTISILMSDSTASLRGTLVTLATAALPMAFFLIASNCASQSDGREFFYRFFLIYGTWLALQTLAAAGSLLIQTGGIAKIELATAVGKSNFIASHLLICLILLTFWRSMVRPWVRWCATGLVAVAFLLTSSFGAIVVFVAVAAVALTQKGAPKRVAGGIAVLVGIFGVLYVVSQFLGASGQVSEVLSIPLDRFDRKLGYWSSGNVERLTAGRDGLYEIALEQINDAPWFGSVTLIEFGGQETRTHNWVLDALVGRGMIGLVAFVGAVVAAVAPVWKQARDDWWLKVTLLGLLAGLMHGMAEPNFFARNFDFLWWTLAGAAVGTASFCQSKDDSLRARVLEIGETVS